MDGLARDIRLAARRLLKAPAFTLIAAGTLALGIGVNTAIFSVVDAVLLRDLPYDAPDELVTVWLDKTRREGPEREWLTPGDFEEYRSAPNLFAEIGAWGGINPTLTGVGEPQVVTAAAVTEGMFERVLKVEPAHGRGFLPEEDIPGGAAVVVLSHGFWQRNFGADPSVLGRTLSLNEVPAVVVGVMPEGFAPPFVPNAQVWTPIQLDPARCGFGCYTIRAIARMAPGISLDAARLGASRVAGRLEEEHPAENGKVGVSIFELQKDLVRPVERSLWVLFGAVALVLLIACTNVANLLLARSAAREGEFAMRVALGAGRASVLRQLLTESVLLAAIGGAAGVTLAAWATDALIAMAPGLAVPGLAEAGVDLRVLMFTAALTLGSGVLFGFVPALRASRPDIYARTRRGGPQGRLASSLVAVQIAMALVLLVGAGLLVRSFQQLSDAELGFDPEGVLTMTLALPGARYADSDSRISYYESLLDRLEREPGITSVGATSSLPLGGTDGDAEFRIEGEPPPDPTDPNKAWIRRVTGGYFPTVDLPLVAGRNFEDGDDARATRVVIVNETLARRYYGYPGRDPLGTRVTFGDGTDPNWRTIIGIARDTRHFAIRDGTRPAMYFPYAQVPATNMSIAIRTAGDPLNFAASARSAVSAVDAALAASTLAPMTDLVADALATDRFVTRLLSAFAVVALLLATVGLYGVVSYGASRRRQEMGIRVAMGATGRDIRRLVVRRGLGFALLGVGIGVVGAFTITGLLEALLYDVPATDVVTFAGTASVLVAVALLASWLPARKAGRVDPVLVLREE
ncbi:MAG: ABC transporter permease [Gammaproteobacteria bacterium]|nr:ABC transporter permease [Gammaproteobacteria bacterium]MYL07612.1 ABC transporter permease [Gemmatimonadales bacterium]